jgi:hypothetical protein
MNTSIERQIYNLRSTLNKMVITGISLTDEKVVKLSVALDNLLNIYHSQNKYGKNLTY